VLEDATGYDAVETSVTRVVEMYAVWQEVNLLVVSEVVVPVLISNEGDPIPESFLRKKAPESVTVRLATVQLAVVDKHRQMAQNLSCTSLPFIGFVDVIVRYFEDERMDVVCQQQSEDTLHAAFEIAAALFLISVIDASRDEAVVIAAHHKVPKITLVCHSSIDFLTGQAADTESVNFDGALDAVTDDVGNPTVVLPVHIRPTVADIGYSQCVIMASLYLVWLVYQGRSVIDPHLVDKV
jgi:hypothetical protein